MTPVSLRRICRFLVVVLVVSLAGCGRPTVPRPVAPTGQDVGRVFGTVFTPRGFVAGFDAGDRAGQVLSWWASGQVPSPGGLAVKPGPEQDLQLLPLGETRLRIPIQGLDGQ